MSVLHGEFNPPGYDPEGREEGFLTRISPMIANFVFRSTLQVLIGANSRNSRQPPAAPVAISPAGTLVASAGTNNTIRLANLADGSAIRRLSDHTDRVASIAFSPDGTLLASTGEDRTLRLWDVNTGTLLRTILQGGGTRQFSAAAFDPDGKHVAADRNRTNVVLWKVSDGWVNFGEATTNRNTALPLDGTGAMFRVIEAAQ